MGRKERDFLLFGTTRKEEEKVFFSGNESCWSASLRSQVALLGVLPLLFLFCTYTVYTVQHSPFSRVKAQSTPLGIRI